jgi:hypothetical protein
MPRQPRAEIQAGHHSTISGEPIWYTLRFNIEIINEDR